MRLFLLFFTLILSQLHAEGSLQNTTCKRCHPTIYKEYYQSLHRRASIFEDPVHNAVWQHHPLRKKQNYTCKKCHTPSDTKLMATKGVPQKTRLQTEEPISCIYCHSIQSVEKHAKANRNILHKQNGKRPLLYSADKSRKGKKVTFNEKHGFLGLSTKVTGSPYHDIDFGNELYYTGKVCLGCHDHKQNAAHFNVCEIGLKKGNGKETCISCHMPKVEGSATTIKDTKTHAYHGIGTLHSMKEVMRHLKIAVLKEPDGFTVTLHNDSEHTLFMHPLRMAKLLVTLQHDGKEVPLPDHVLQRLIGKDGKPSSPWLADSVVKNTTLKAHEHKSYHYNNPLQHGDIVEVKIGYYRVNPKAAKMLGLSKNPAAQMEIVKKQRFHF
jgi:nitrate/TMAO reductase-like tetraheme cytochrome c subunit